ncbi:hydrolase [Kitasatospora sp. MMS16-BH015]|uniref:HAD family hydrolase n=1 Tax=Kitasatospora sp. MMS16-BH015 TaxID=2018025 RepID=UPI000CA361D5|nr:HAD-IB family hydrolase [Kitasatospora sp. MMS16-BH015]AUG77957.1 hydrolase [Kitasatospora sp. MMS16-BH015]
MAALRRLTQARRTPTERTALAGEAAAEAAEAALVATPKRAPKAPEGNHTPTPDDPRAAAFFDCDNTILRGAAIFYLGIGLYRRRFFSRWDVARFAWQQASFRLLGSEDPAHIADAQDTALGLVAGKRTAELEQICEEIFEQVIAEKIWPGTRALVQMHLDAGQRVWLVTAAPLEVARIIARRLGMTGALGTVAEAVDGVYTGRLVGGLLHGEAKAAAVAALARREQLDLTHCAAFSDSANDIPMLALVGHPYVVNPDATLRRHARRMGWRVRDFRTGRKAARIGLPAAAGLGILAGLAAVTLAERRKRR